VDKAPPEEIMEFVRVMKTGSLEEQEAAVKKACTYELPGEQ